MTSSVSIAVGKANQAGAENGPKQVRIRTHTLAVMRAARSVFPEKTVEQLVAITQASETTVKEWMRGEREMRLDHYARLLATEHTMRFLDAATEKKRPAIWSVLKAIIGAAHARKLQAMAQRHIQRAVTGAFDADAEITASISRAEAFLLHDEDFYRPHFDAVGAECGAQNSPVAAASGKGREK